MKNKHFGKIFQTIRLEHYASVGLAPPFSKAFWKQWQWTLGYGNFLLNMKLTIIIIIKPDHF